MAELIHIESGNLGDVDDHKLYDYLDSGLYEFAGEETAIHTVDPEDVEGLGNANYMNRADAKRYVLQGIGKYMNPEEVQSYTNRFRYGDREGTAAALGAAGALSFGIIPGVAGLLSEEASGIMEANPRWMIGSDIMTTLAALALAPETGGASTLAAAGAVGRLGRVVAQAPGLRTLIAAAKKAPWKYTAPAIADKLGKGVEFKIAQKLLGEAAEDQLQKAGWRGLAARMGGMTAESMIYAAGYSIPDAINERMQGRTWEEVALSYSQNMGAGTLIGLAIPTVFQGGMLTAGKGFEYSRKLMSMPVKWAMDSKVAKSAARFVAEGADEMSLNNQFGKAADQIDIEEVMTSMGSEAVQADIQFSRQLNRMVGKTTNYIKEFSDTQEFIRKNTQGGLMDEQHIKGVMESIPVDVEGSASTGILLDQLLNGNFGNEKALSHGFLHVLGGEVKELLGSAQKPFRTGKFKEVGRDKVTGEPIMEEILERLDHTAEKELKGILAEVEYLQNYAENFVDSAMGGKEVVTSGALKAWLRHKPGKVGGKDPITGKTQGVRDLKRWQKFNDYYSRHKDLHLPDRTTQQNVVSAWIQDWEMAKWLNPEFNAHVFSKLEKLSSRIHRTIPHGSFKANNVTETWRQRMLDHIRDFTTQTGDTWKGVQESPFNTPFGHMQDIKTYINRMMRARDTQHDLVLKRFSVPDPEFPDVPKIDAEKVEGLLRTINYGDSKHAVHVLKEYVDKNIDILKFIHTFMPASPPPGSQIWAKKQAAKVKLEEAMALKVEYVKHIDLMKTDMKKALEFSAILDAEAKHAMAMPNRGLVPYSVGTGAIAGGIAYAAGMEPEYIAAAGMVGLAGRYGYDAMSSPGRAMAQMHKFFVAADKFDQFFTEQVDRYFSWLNKVSPVTGPLPQGDRINRLAYHGPGSGTMGRYPSILTSKFVADYVGPKAADKFRSWIDKEKEEGKE